MVSTPQKKTGCINTSVAPVLKAKAEKVLARLGVTTTEAVTMFLNQIVFQQGLPFLVRIPNAETAAALKEVKEHSKSMAAHENVVTMVKDIRPGRKAEMLATLNVETPKTPQYSMPLDAQTQKATQAFFKRISRRYSVREAILFGSRARNTHTPESDADIAVVLKGSHGNRTAAVKDMAGIAFHVMMETGVMVEALPLWADDVEHPETFSNPALINNILLEGIRL